MTINVVQAVKDGKGYFEWKDVCSEYEGYKLYISVFRDAMKFDNIPALTWDFKPVSGDDRIFHGVRLPADAKSLQEIAYLLNCMLMTPKVIDMIWLQADIKFNSIVNIQGKIVAISHINNVHEAIEKTIEKEGGDNGEGLISCVGKYWCLINELANFGATQFGKKTACNYGWCGTNASGPGVTPGVKCWQRPGFRHNDSHYDPSQVIRLMHRWARLVHPDGTEEQVDLHDIAKDEEKSKLITHQSGGLKYLVQADAEVLEPMEEPGVITLPEVTIYGEIKERLGSDNKDIT